jgi:hypothetical protein
MNRSTVIRFLSAFVFVAAFATSAAAQQGPGARAGVSVNPDQFYIGGHYDTGEIVDRVHLRPNIELGFGDDVTTVAFNIEALYMTPLPRSPWTFYAGGGPGVNVYDFDNGSDTEAGLNVLAGLQHDNGFFFEVKGGLFDSPDMKIGVGYTWKR